MVGTNGDYKLTVHREPPDTSIGTLTIPAVSMADSGNYTCAPASLQMASVMLHVVIGELRVLVVEGVLQEASDEGIKSDYYW